MPPHPSEGTSCQDKRMSQEGLGCWAAGAMPSVTVQDLQQNLGEFLSQTPHKSTPLCKRRGQGSTSRMFSLRKGKVCHRSQRRGPASSGRRLRMVHIGDNGRGIDEVRQPA